MKDQSKKVASLKHKEQVEKSKNARLMEEARKREDNMSENSQQVKVSNGWGLPWLVLTKFSASNLAYSYVFRAGHTASEGGAHRGVGRGSKGECSDHCWARDGTGTGGGCPVTPGETGKITPLPNIHLTLFGSYSTLPFATTEVCLLLSSLPSSCLALVSFHLPHLCLWFFLVFSLLHSASQKHSLKPMHESHLAHLKWSKVRVRIVWPPSVSNNTYRGGHTNSNTSIINAVLYSQSVLRVFMKWNFFFWLFHLIIVGLHYII